MENLALIIPVYNEDEAISFVINEWVEELEKLKIDFTIFAYNDGSKDNTSIILKNLSDLYKNVVAIDKSNSGHGPTILQGYLENAETYTWLFQVDSDNEMQAKDFYKLWEKRNDYDFLLGTRENRVQPLARKIISLVSRCCINIFYGRGIYDVNSPYRLMRSEKFVNIFKEIPRDTFAPNLIVSGYVAKKKLRILEQNVPCYPRETGEVSIKKWKLLKAAIKSFWQTILFSFHL